MWKRQRHGASDDDKTFQDPKSMMLAVQESGAWSHTHEKNCCVWCDCGLCTVYTTVLLEWTSLFCVCEIVDLKKNCVLKFEDHVLEPFMRSARRNGDKSRYYN